MKKKRVASFLLIGLLSISMISYRVHALSNMPVQYSNEEQYKNIISSLLMQYIDETVDGYYTKFLDQKPLIDPWDVKILSVEKPNDFFIFVIKMEVMPYVGPHLTVGVDRITIIVEGTGQVKVNNFEHIESTYQLLPPNWQNIIKKNPKIN